MPTTNNPTKNSNDIEDERERRQEQAAQQSRDEMGRFEEGAEADVHERQTSRMNTPDDEEVHAQVNQGRQRGKNPSSRDEHDRADGSGADEADDLPDDLPVDRDLETSEDESQRGDSDVVSSEDSERESERPGRAQVSQVGRSKQSINASKRPRDQHGRFESSSRKKRSDDSRSGNSSNE